MGEQGKACRINVRVTSAERAAIAQRAQQKSLSTSEYIRRAALAQDPTRTVVEVDATTLQTMYRNLKLAGSNVNQIARWLNSHTSYYGNYQGELSLALAAISNAASDISEAINYVRTTL